MRKIALILFFLVSCSDNFTTQDADFRELCLTRGDDWMIMPETIDGRVTGSSCYGCMPNQRNHICKRDQYEAYIGEGGYERPDTYSPPAPLDPS